MSKHTIRKLLANDEMDELQFDANKYQGCFWMCKESLANEGGEAHVSFKN